MAVERSLLLPFYSHSFIPFTYIQLQQKSLLSAILLCYQMFCTINLSQLGLFNLTR